MHYVPSSLDRDLALRLCDKGELDERGLVVCTEIALASTRGGSVDPTI